MLEADGVRSSQTSFTPFDSSAVNSNLDDPPSSAATAGDKTQLRCQVPDCSEGREFFTESALRYGYLLSPSTYANSHCTGSIKTSTANLISVLLQDAGTLDLVTRGAWTAIDVKYTARKSIAAQSLPVRVTQRDLRENTIFSSTRSGVILCFRCAYLDSRSMLSVRVWKKHKITMWMRRRWTR
jgi:hypothetical protein